jgi:drug/metabolite transporter (DMT)-like permease
MPNIGIVFATLAVFGWGFGDFLIQRSTRKLGDWETLFFVTLFAAIVLLPFVLTSFAMLSLFDWALLIGTSVVILVAALLDFEALRVGKIAIVSPVYAMEVPITIALSTLLIGEHLTIVQLELAALLLLGVFLISNKHLGRIRIKSMERGVLVAALAMLGMSLSNFLYGFSSRATGPLLINWFTSAFMAVTTLIYLVSTSQGSGIVRNLRHNKRLIFSIGFFDTIAWVAYSSSTLTLPIGLATGLTESYIAVSAILGIVLNKEKLARHQNLGLIVAIFAAIFLAVAAAN